MDCLLNAVEFLVAVGSDSGTPDDEVPGFLMESEGWLNKDDTEQLWETIQADVSCLPAGVRALLREADVDSKLGLCLLYFRMLNSAGCPVRYCIEKCICRYVATASVCENWERCFCRTKMCLTSSASICAGKLSVKLSALQEL